MPLLSESIRNAILHLDTIEVIRLIQSGRISMNSIFEYRNTTLWHNAVIKPHPDNIQLLRELISLLLDDDKALLNQLDLNGLAPLHYAISNNNVSAIRILILYGADPNQLTGKGKSLVDFAIDALCKSEVLDCLIKLTKQYNEGNLPSPSIVYLKLLSNQANDQANVEHKSKFFKRIYHALLKPLKLQNKDNHAETHNEIKLYNNKLYL